VIPLPIMPGDEVACDFGKLGGLEIRFADR
jgi:hypothetical protein